MLNLVLKSAAYTVAALIVRDAYPNIKETCIKTYDSLCEFMTSEESNPIVRIEGKQPRNQLTEYQYTVLMDAYKLNNSLPKSSKINQQELCNRLNTQLGLKYTRSGYAHFFRKRVIPEFNRKSNE